MKWYIVITFLLTSFFLFFAVLRAIFLNDKRMARRMQRYLTIDNQQPLSNKKITMFAQLQLYKKAVRENVLSKSRNESLMLMLRRAGVPIKPEEYVIMQWICSILGGSLMFLFFSNLFLSIIGVVVGYLAPGWWIKSKTNKRVKEFNSALPDMIATAIGSLRAGFSFPQALRTVADESAGPMKEEMETVLLEMQYGSSLEEALHELKERMQSEDLDLMTQAIVIQKQVGGNLATVLEAIVTTIRDRTRIERQVLTLTAQGRLSGRVIGMLPVGLGLMLYMIDSNYFGVLFTHPIGQMMIGGAVFLGIIGFVIMNKLTKIEV